MIEVPKKVVKKSQAPKKAADQATEPLDNEKEFLILGHLIKYNLYLLTKAVVFNAIMSSSKSSDEDVAARTNAVLERLDLSNKPKE